MGPIKFVVSDSNMCINFWNDVPQWDKIYKNNCYSIYTGNYFYIQDLVSDDNISPDCIVLNDMMTDE